MATKTRGGTYIRDSQLSLHNIWTEHKEVHQDAQGVLSLTELIDLVFSEANSLNQSPQTFDQIQIIQATFGLL